MYRREVLRFHEREMRRNREKNILLFSRAFFAENEPLI